MARGSTVVSLATHNRNGCGAIVRLSQGHTRLGLHATHIAWENNNNTAVLPGMGELQRNKGNTPPHTHTHIHSPTCLTPLHKVTTWLIPLLRWWNISY